MGIPYIFISFVFFSLYILYNMKKDTNGPSSFQMYLDDETKANFARKRDIDSSLYVTPDIDILPFKNDLDEKIYSRLISKQKDVIEKSGKKMIFIVPPQSNKELKLKYGVANLETISTCEDNYRKYIISLLSWAEALEVSGFENDAAAVLEQSISFGSDFRKSYTRLGDIYKKQKNISALNELYKKATLITGSSKEFICDYLNILLNEVISK